MPAGEDEVRKKYFLSGRTHPNRRSKKKTGFEGNNWPSTRTYYSNIPLHVVALSKTFQYYVSLVGLHYVEGKYSRIPKFLELVSKTKTGYYVSNYTISGMLNEKWGVRHRPKPTTQRAIQKLIEWLQDLAREMGVYKPFIFKYDKDDLVNVQTKTTNQQTNEHRSKKEKKGKSRWVIVSEDEAIHRWSNIRRSNHIWRLLD